MLSRRTLFLVGLLGVLMLAATASADLFRGRFRVGEYKAEPAGGQMAWSQLAAQSGLRTAVEMSSWSDIDTGGNGTTVINQSVGGPFISYDAVKNAMKISIPASLGSPGIAWTKSLAYANQFAEGSDIWVQFDVQWDAGMLAASNGGGSIKVFTLDEGIQSDGFNPGSCDNGGSYEMQGQIFMSANNQITAPFPTLASICNRYEGVYSYLTDGDVGYESKITTCTYRQVNATPVTNGCYRFLPNTWYTITMHVHVGTWAPCDTDACLQAHHDSQIDLWVSQTGVTAPVYILSVPNFALVNYHPSGVNQGKYGKVWLFPNDFGRYSGNVDGNVWYRHVLMGGSPLKDPTSGQVLVADGSTPGTPPASTLTAVYHGVSTDDKVGQSNQTTPNGHNDHKVTVAGLRSVPVKVFITTGFENKWLWPFDGLNWIIDVGTTSVPTATYWFEPDLNAPAHVKVYYADGSTDEADATPVGAPTTFTLTVQKVGTGTVTSSVPSGAIACGGDCTETIVTGTAFTMSASAGANYVFAGWQGSGCTGTGTCSLTLTANTTITATFSSTQTPGNLASIPANGWLKVVPNASSRYTFSGGPECFQGITVSANPVTNAFSGSNMPHEKGYGGIVYGAGKLFYFGGGHYTAPGNSVEVYDTLTNVWTESYKPEVCYNICSAHCGGIYGGAASDGTHTPLNRAYVEQMYQKSLYNPVLGQFELHTKGTGPWRYNTATQQLLEIPLTGRADGIYAPWSSDQGHDHAFFDPITGLSTHLVTTGGTGPGFWQQTDTSTSPAKWQIVGAWPAELSNAYAYSTYVTTQSRHLMLAVGNYPGTPSPGGSAACPNPKEMWWLNTATWSMTQITLPADVAYADVIGYDSVHNKIVAMQTCVNPIRIWEGTTANTPVWTEKTLTTTGQSNVNFMGIDTTSMTAFIYDDQNNVFWYIHVNTADDPIELWAYRLQ